jgi:hypothetical protein
LAHPTREIFSPNPIIKKIKTWKVPGNHVAARVGKLDVRNGGDNFREKGPVIKRKRL